MSLQDALTLLRDDSIKRQRTDIAELSRPARTIREHDKKKKKYRYLGLKRARKHLTNATYINWHTPFLWSQIDSAAKDPSVGRGMSASAIVSLLKKRNPEDFGPLSRSTVNGWIDRSGKHPQWTSGVINMVKNGHLPGGHGGRIGILVWASSFIPILI